MKTHTSRWFKNSPSTWVLKARAQDGGAVLARIEDKGPRFYVWGAVDFYGGWSESMYGAQRQVRAALQRDSLAAPTRDGRGGGE